MRIPAIVALLALAAGAHAQSISGSVQANGAPLRAAKVIIEVNGKQFAELASDAQGRFSVDVRGAGSLRDVQVTISSPSFQSVSHLRSGNDLGRAFDVVLLPSEGPSNLTADEQAKLKSLVLPGPAGQAGPILFAPYALPADVAGADLNERLRIQLQRLILTHVQSALTEGDTRGLALTRLPVPTPEDLLRLRAMGEFVDAPAVVSGRGFREGDPAQPVLAFESQYVIIPRPGSFDPPVLNIADSVPVQSVGRMQLDSKMSGMWGRATVLALAARDLQAAGRIADRAQRMNALKRVQRYLQAERANLGARDVLGEAKLRQLLDLVGEELKR